MRPQSVLWLVVVFLAAASFIFGFGGFVETTRMLATATGLTFLVIVLLNWRAQTGEQS